MSAPAARAPVMSAYVDGIGLWAPRLPGWAHGRAILRGEAEAPAACAPRPTPELLPPNERRRAPDAVAIALEVAARACVDAGCDPKSLPSVFASTYGDLVISDYMCGMLARAPLEVSPTRFHHSVHNAAAGYWSIATGSHEPYTALTADRYTFGSGLLAALTQVHTEGSPVLLVAYDIEGCGPLASMARSRGMLGAALVLAPERGSRSSALLSWRVEAASGPSSSARAPNAALVAGNAVADCLALLEALAEAAQRELAQSLARGLQLRVSLEPLPRGG
jgi:hypothetical protein